MNVKAARHTHTHLALALLLLALLYATRTSAVVNPGQFTSHPPQPYYSQSPSSYGNEQQNYFSNPGELSASNGYGANEPVYKRQPISYASSAGGFDDNGGAGQQRDTYQSPQISYEDYLSGSFSPLGQEEEFAVGGYGREYGGERGTPTGQSPDNFEFHNTGAMVYQGAAENVAYPPLDSRMYQQRQQQPYGQSTAYMTANNNASPSTDPANQQQSTQYSYSSDKLRKDSAVSSTANIAEAIAKLQLNARHQINAQPYTGYQKQDERTGQHPHNFEHQFSNNDRLTPDSSSRNYHADIADSDISASTSTSNHLNQLLDFQSLSALQSHLSQLPGESSSLPAKVGEPIPIAKHVAITKHVPIPVYRQVRVPFRKLVRIQIPRPVITTVPRPYPIHIPAVMKPVALPVVKEVKIPIEKVTPYPVEHKVPYVVEKRVPFQVEKQVAAPIYYPFPVKVPMVRTILHKKKSHDISPVHYAPSRLHI